MDLPLALAGNLGYLITNVARQYRVMFDREMQPLGLTRSQWWTLAHVYYYDGISQTALAALLDIDKAAVARLIARMLAKGWVERRPNAQDARAKEIYLSPPIRALMADITALSEQLIAQSLASIGTRQMADMRLGLAQLSANLNQMDGHPHEAAMALRSRIQTALAVLSAPGPKPAKSNRTGRAPP